MEHEDEGQASTALTRLAVLLAQCAVVGVAAGVITATLVVIVRIGQ